MPELSELEKIRIEKEKLELEISRETVERMRSEKAVKVRNRQTVERDLMNSREAEQRRHEACNHRKGGLGVDGYKGRGNDGGNYAINQQTELNGTPWVLCLRCMKEWHKGDPQYAEAMRWPTDNEPSSGCTFNNLLTV